MTLTETIKDDEINNIKVTGLTNTQNLEIENDLSSILYKNILIIRKKEINRIITDRISDILFCPTDTAILNLKNEGKIDSDIKIVKNGDVMQDAAIYYSEKSKQKSVIISQFHSKFLLMGIWGEWLWFVSQGYESRFWRLLLAQVVAVLGGGLLAGSIGFLLALYAGTHLRRLVAGIGVLAGIIWGLKHYLLVLLFIYGVPTGVVEPILQQPTSFYLFTLPLLDSVF